MKAIKIHSLPVLILVRDFIPGISYFAWSCSSLCQIESSNFQQQIENIKYKMIYLYFHLKVM